MKEQDRPVGGKEGILHDLEILEDKLELLQSTLTSIESLYTPVMYCAEDTLKYIPAPTNSNTNSVREQIARILEIVVQLETAANRFVTRCAL